MAQRCDYCGAPLPADVVAASGAAESTTRRYCCYGCRILGESRTRPSEASGLAEPAAGAPWFKIGLGVALASQAMLMGFAVNLSPPEGSVRILLHSALAGSALTVLILLGWPLLKASWECVGRRRVTLELLFLAGIIGAFGASVFSSLTRIGAVYYEVVAVLLVVYTVGKTLTARARSQAWAETARLRQTFDSCQRIGMDGATEFVPASQIQAGDRIRVAPNEPIPVDGRVIEGHGFVRETPLTGEPYPIVRRAGDPVWAGSWSEDGEFLIEATTPGKSRQLDTLLQWVERARANPEDRPENPDAVPWIDRVTAAFLPVVILTSVGTWLVWGWQGLWAPGLFNALAVLLVACPCALGLAAPLAWWQALATLAARGIACRSTDALERLGEIRHVVFDKTGTLSEERQSLIDFAALGDDHERSRLLALLREVQRQSSHPIARAFVSEGSERDPRIRILSLKLIPASGLEAWVELDGRELRLQTGTRDWVLSGNATIPDAEAALLQKVRALPSDQRIYIALDGALRALGIVRERLRDTAPEAIAQLARLGCTITVLTGDHPERAAQLLRESSGADAKSIGIIEGSLTPGGKARKVDSLIASGTPVAFVGDGVNDAPALRSASVGIALNSGSALAAASADLVLCGGDLRQIPAALALARQTRSRIRSNLIFALAYNLLGMALAATGQIGPISAALLMVGSSTIVSWRALRTGTDLCELDPPARSKGATVFYALLALSFLLQIPALGWLGQLRPAPLAFVSVVLTLLAAIAATWRRNSRSIQPTWFGPGFLMILAMLGPGNLGMLLGWWIEAGFGPVMKDGVCLCCQSHQYFALTGKVPWMYLGMLAGGVPPMWLALARFPGRLGRWPLAMLAAIGMVVGMAGGAEAVLGWLGPRHPHQFLGAFIGMTLGMGLGMAFACAAGEAAAAALKVRGPAKRRSSAGRTLGN